MFMIDELDAVSSNRARSDSTSASGEMNRTTISLMQNLDRVITEMRQDYALALQEKQSDQTNCLC